jgi:hypothetical protein
MYNSKEPQQPSDPPIAAAPNTAPKQNKGAQKDAFAKSLSNTGQHEPPCFGSA